MADDSYGRIPRLISVDIFSATDHVRSLFLLSLDTAEASLHIFY